MSDGLLPFSGVGGLGPEFAAGSGGSGEGSTVITGDEEELTVGEIADGELVERDGSELVGVSGAASHLIIVPGTQPVNNVAFGAGVDTAFFNAGAGISFDVEISGAYMAQFFFNVACIGASVLITYQIKLVFDEGEANEQTLGYNTMWQANSSGYGFTYPNFKGLIGSLTAGTHTVRGYGKSLGAGGIVSVVGTTTYGPLQDCTLLLTYATG